MPALPPIQAGLKALCTEYARLAKTRTGSTPGKPALALCHSVAGLATAYCAAV